MIAAASTEPAWTAETTRSAAIVVGIALASSLLMLFIIWPVQHMVDTKGDPYDYSAIATRMIREGFAAGGLTKREASLYPALIADIYWLFGERPFLVRLLQCGLFAVTAFFVFDLGRRLYNPRTAIIAGVLFALNPVPLRYVADLHMETLLTLMVTVNVWTMVRFYRRPAIGWGLAVGLTAALAALTKGVALIPPFVFGALLVFQRLFAKPRRSPAVPWSAIIAIAFATGITILPWTVRNYHVTGGRVVLLGPGLSDAFLRGYVFSRAEYALLERPPYVDAENECNAWFSAICRRAGTEFGRDEVRDEQTLGAVAKQKIAEEPLELLRKTAVGMLTFWYQMTNLVNSLVTGTIALALLVLASVGAGRSRREARHSWLLWLPVLSMNVVIALLCSLGRYSTPIIPCLVVLAAFGIDTLLVSRNVQPRRDAV